jgi:hypothetical protein
MSRIKHMETMAIALLMQPIFYTLWGMGTFDGWTDRLCVLFCSGMLAEFWLNCARKGESR